MSAPRRWRLAACQYPVERLPDFATYAGKLENLTAEAIAAGSQLVLFPEYGAMELAALLEPGAALDLRRQLREMQGLLPAFLDLHREIARYHGIYLSAASFPVEVAPHAFRNRVHLFSPAGAHAVQDKITMTRFEHERWGITGGAEIMVFDTDLGRIALDICYDAELPHIACWQVQAGATVVLVPSCTDGLTGYSRVHVAARARALENQCFVAISPTVGTAPWSAAVDENVGAAGVFAPPDRGFPADGVLASGTLNEPGWVYADLDIETLCHLQRDAEVFSRRDWHRVWPASPTVRYESLSA